MAERALFLGEGEKKKKDEIQIENVFHDDDAKTVLRTSTKRLTSEYEL